MGLMGFHRNLWDHSCQQVQDGPHKWSCHRYCAFFSKQADKQLIVLVYLKYYPAGKVSRNFKTGHSINTKAEFS